MAKSENRRPKRPRIRYSRPKPKAKEAEYRNSLGNFELFKTNGINCAHVKKLLNLFEKLIMQKKIQLTYNQTCPVMHANALLMQYHYFY